MAKLTFTMQITDTEKDIMEFVTEVCFQENNFSKADVVSALFKQHALNYLNMNISFNDISDEEILTLLKSAKRDKDSLLVRFLGTDKYKDLIEQYKKEYPNGDSSYMEELLADYIQRGEK
jgi:hypothetical protein